MRTKLLFGGLFILLFIVVLLVIFYFFTERENTPQEKFLNSTGGALSTVKNVTPEERMLQIAENSTSVALNRVALNYDWGIISREIITLNGFGYANITANYSFGCCGSGGGVGAAVCTSCGVKTIVYNFVINSAGAVTQNDTREIACRENTEGSWRSRALNGGDCLIIKGDYKCPGYKSLDCSSNLVPEMMWFCIEPYHQWIKENCNITFSY